MIQHLYGGVTFPSLGPDIDNVQRIDLNCLPMIFRMQATGLQVDLNHFAKMEKKLVQDLDRLTEDVYTMTGFRANLDSGDQVSHLLFKQLGLKQARRQFTKSGDRESVISEVLLAIQHEHPIISLLLEYKEVSKLLGTYVRPMPKLAKRSKFGEWRMFPQFGVTRIPSGRLNCREPNLLAMPNRSARGREVCEGFITNSDMCYLSVDLSQIEPRVVAHRSKDKNLVRVYHNEEDIYSDFAIVAFKIPDKRYRDDEGWHYPGVDKKKNRFPAKTAVLASIYEVSAKGLTEQLPVMCANCEKEATKHDCGKFVALWHENTSQQLINSFYMAYPGILDMRRMDHARARKHTMVWDDFGRLLHTTAVKSVHKWVVSAALREAGNHSIQSGAQGILKIAMARIDDEFNSLGIYGDIANPLLQIHDELVLEVKNEHADGIGEWIIDCFENIIRLDVPVKASMATSVNWGKLSK